MSDYKADNDWLRHEMATNMVYKKEADELRDEIERLRAENADLKEKVAYLIRLTDDEPPAH